MYYPLSKCSIVLLCPLFTRCIFVRHSYVYCNPDSLILRLLSVKQDDRSLISKHAVRAIVCSLKQSAQYVFTFNFAHSTWYLNIHGGIEISQRSHKWKTVHCEN
jgi:hypothetical protein